MKFVIILGHQRLGSFNHAIAETACRTLRDQGHEVVFHDLYAEGFDPVLRDEEITVAEVDLPGEIRCFIDEIREADGLVFVHPNWWGSPPAILRGWIERVFRQGFAYHFTLQGPVPHLTDKAVFVFSTSNTPHNTEYDVYGDPVGKFWEVIVFGLCGCKCFRRTNFGSVIMSTPEDRECWLDEVRKTFLDQ